MRLATKRLDWHQSIYLQAPSDTASKGWIFCAAVDAIFEASITITLMLIVAGVLWLRRRVDDFLHSCATNVIWCKQWTMLDSPFFGARKKRMRHLPRAVASTHQGAPSRLHRLVDLWPMTQEREKSDPAAMASITPCTSTIAFCSGSRLARVPIGPRPLLHRLRGRQRKKPPEACA